MRVTIDCPCGTPFKVQYKVRHRRTYCSKECRMKYRNGVGNPEFNARIAQDTALQRGDTLRGRGEGKSYIKEEGQHQHITVMERLIRRRLWPGEIVHHIDGDFRNNAPSNLQLMPSRSAHAREHALENAARRRHRRRVEEAAQ